MKEISDRKYIVFLFLVLSLPSFFYFHIFILGFWLSFYLYLNFKNQDEGNVKEREET